MILGFIIFVSRLEHHKISTMNLMSGLLYILMHINTIFHGNSCLFSNKLSFISVDFCKFGRSSVAHLVIFNCRTMPDLRDYDSILHPA
jgi:hypothetical protein